MSDVWGLGQQSHRFGWLEEEDDVEEKKQLRIAAAVRSGENWGCFKLSVQRERNSNFPLLFSVWWWYWMEERE